MHANATLLNSFYTAFQRRDPAGMISCYGPGAAFRDPVFNLDGWRVGAMWQMLCDRGKDLRVEYRVIGADDAAGAASWEAWYTFSGTGRPVHNIIQASFTFQDGEIARHEDRFDLHRWAAQALGPKGYWLGWAPPVQRAIRRNAARALDAFIARHGLSEPMSSQLPRPGEDPRLHS